MADFFPLRVSSVTAAGKRRFDSDGKRKLIDACLQPGASIAGLALKAGVNANQLYKWIHLRERANAAAATVPVEPLPSAFVSGNNCGRMMACQTLADDRLKGATPII